MLGCGGFGRHPTKVLDEILRITRPGKLSIFDGLVAHETVVFRE